MILGILMSNEVKIAVLETQVERLLEKQKELTERVRANEKVVAAIGLLGSIAVAFIGAGYFAPRVEACSPRLDGEPTYCPDTLDDIKLPRKQLKGDVDVFNANQWHQMQFLFLENKRMEDIEKNATQPKDSINSALENFWEVQDGSNGSTES